MEAWLKLLPTSESRIFGITSLPNAATAPVELDSTPQIPMTPWQTQEPTISLLPYKPDRHPPREPATGTQAIRGVSPVRIDPAPPPNLA